MIAPGAIVGSWTVAGAQLDREARDMPLRVRGRAPGCG